MTEHRPDTPDLAGITDAMRDALDRYRQAWEQIRRAMAEAWAGPLGQAMRRHAAITEARRAHRADGYRDYRHEPYPPSGCRYCDHPERGHGRRYSKRLGIWPYIVGWHRYRAPWDGLTLDRMRARRAARLNRSTSR